VWQRRSYWVHGAAELAAEQAVSAASAAVKLSAREAGVAGRPASKAERSAQCCLLRDLLGNPFAPSAADVSWLSGTVVALAQAIYDERAFDRVPILADALEDAGCTDEVILAHCRGPGPHVQGCWLVDLVVESQTPDAVSSPLAKRPWWRFWG
jgi:hypothetical protein